MNLVLSILMLIQALSLPIPKKYGILNSAYNQLLHSTSLIEIDTAPYRIIIEASSTKVKQCLYHISANELHRDCEKKVYKPIQEFSSNDIKDELTKTLELLKNIPPDVKIVPVDILATAGMRTLSLTRQNKVWERFIDVWERFISKLHESQELQLYSIQDMSGVEEGIYGCMIANVAIGKLDLSLTIQTKNSKDLVGIVEIGGSSVQIAVPQKDIENTFSFNDFYSRSLPFGKVYFFHQIMNDAVPKDCKFLDKRANYDECYWEISQALSESKNHFKNKFGMPKKLQEVDSYYLLGGTFEAAWGKKQENNVNLDKLQKWTENVCNFVGVDIEEQKLSFWREEASLDPLAWGYNDLMKCYTAVYAYSFLKEFLPGKVFHVGLPLSNDGYLEDSSYVDWPSAAYMFLQSHSFDQPSSEIRVKEIMDKVWSNDTLKNI